ncbi:hypothetical protein JAAARDRAFT_457286 [Jaapia argillacea MUCL 33604]|uniref:Uncharacterized protein n=1 Tax=Jaapia argillacea MUCL 33604 TaxID=933084 RepID=A0A067Q5S6_9AGAM|nr:hypothetical protein JAAARDRAFT_457286 [Jaapia argillacea MUCL 33604]
MWLDGSRKAYVKRWLSSSELICCHCSFGISPFTLLPLSLPPLPFPSALPCSDLLPSLFLSFFIISPSSPSPPSPYSSHSLIPSFLHFSLSSPLRPSLPSIPSSLPSLSPSLFLCFCDPFPSQ